MIFDQYYQKARGKPYDSDEWIYGNYIRTDDASYIVPEDKPEVITLSPHEAIIKARRIRISTFGLNSFYTDKNETELYSGDVLETVTENESPFTTPQRALVMFDRDGWFADGLILISTEEFKFCRLVGNVIDNPELWDSLPDDVGDYLDEEDED